MGARNRRAIDAQSRIVRAVEGIAKTEKTNYYRFTVSPRAAHFWWRAFDG